MNVIPHESTDSAFREGEPPLPEARPRSEPEISRPGYKLFSPRSIGLSAILTGPVGPFVLLTLNYWRLGQRAAGWMTIAVGLLAVAAVTAISFALPESSPGFLIAIPLALGLSLAANALQGKIYDAHRQQGGEPASGWAATGISVLGMLLYVSFVVGLILTYDFYLDASLGQKIDCGGGEEVYYTKGATEADARALGAHLRDLRFFTGQGPKAVRVSLDNNRVTVSFIIQQWALNDPQLQQEFRTIGQQASQRAFGARPVEVELCDEYFNVKKRL